jgi:hypothetical protein
MNTSVLHRTILIALVGSYFVARFALLSTSWDANQNWEEPVFLYSAVELQHAGIGRIFDHQDDLNHGGSIALLLAAVPWFRLFTPDLESLKWLTIVWSAATMIVFLWLLARYISSSAAIAFGVCYVALSPTLARTNLTAVGSHPEALLLCALAVASYLESLRRAQRGSSSSAADFGLGAICGLAVWMSYVSAAFAVPLLVCHTGFRRSVRASTISAIGIAMGLLPWSYQNLWLRPHGATHWRDAVVGPQRDSLSLFDRATATFAELAASFGLPGAGGSIVVATAILVTVVLVAALALKRWRRQLWIPAAVVVPLVVIPLVGSSMLAATDLNRTVGEGYYFYRFFVPLQVSLFMLFALAWDGVRRAGPRWIATGTFVVALAVGVTVQAPLYGLGNSYASDPNTEMLRGCKVYGVAEGARAGNSLVARRNLTEVRDSGCRAKAFGGFGWWLATQADKPDGHLLIRDTLAAIDAPALRWATCGGLYFFAKTFSETQRKSVLGEVGSLCREVRPGVRESTMNTSMPGHRHR